IIRITADSPLLDPILLTNMVEIYKNNNTTHKIEYFSNCLEPTFPLGLSIEIFNFLTLEKTHNEAKKNYQREHVTPYIYENPQIFILNNYKNDTDFSHLRWTLDTPEDFIFIEYIYNYLYRENYYFTTTDVLRLLDLNPWLYDINKH